MSKKKKTTASRISEQYQREPRVVMTWKRLRTNVGAIIGLTILVIMILLMLYSFFFISYEDITKIDGRNRYSPPSAEHPFGTDEMGRDLMKRCIYGTRYSIAIAFGAVTFGLVIGIFFGSISGFFGGWVDQLIMRLTDIITSIPGTLLGMVIVTILGARLINLLIAVGVGCIGGFVRLTRASVLTVRSNEYVESARAIGMPELRIIFTQVLPNAISPLIVSATARMATSVLSAAGLSFLGFGVAVPLPEWGALISGSRNFLLRAPHLCYFPGLFIMAMAFGCALLGDGLRDALDPKLNK